MVTTVEGVYADGKVELNETPSGVEKARVLVVFLPEEQSIHKNRIMQPGMLADPNRRFSTLEDFKAARWRGELEFPDEG